MNEIFFEQQNKEQNQPSETTKDAKEGRRIPNPITKKIIKANPTS